MYRNLKNLCEFVLWASASCGLAFFVRIFESWWFPVLMLRIGFTLYCLYNVLNAPKKSMKFSYCFIGGAVSFGLLGGYWDFLEVILHYQQGEIIGILSALAIAITGFFVVQYWMIDNGTDRE